MKSLFVSKDERLVVNLNQFSYSMTDGSIRKLYFVGDTRPQPIREAHYIELLEYMKKVS